MPPSKKHTAEPPPIAPASVLTWEMMDVAEDQKDMAIIMLKFWKKVYNKLTPEQNFKFIELMKEKHYKKPPSARTSVTSHKLYRAIKKGTVKVDWPHWIVLAKLYSPQDSNLVSKFKEAILKRYGEADDLFFPAREGGQQKKRKAPPPDKLDNDDNTDNKSPQVISTAPATPAGQEAVSGGQQAVILIMTQIPAVAAMMNPSSNLSLSDDSAHHIGLQRYSTEEAMRRILQEAR
ncbi:hypothetical protein G7046_g9250 [Stylonectria norvegica]|nr:hypothetical protein G7046_g9250 [Stylonectria norvegica]